MIFQQSTIVVCLKTILITHFLILTDGIPRQRHYRGTVGIGQFPTNEVISIIEEKCEEYATARYQNITTPGVLEGDPSLVVRELDCIQKPLRKSGVYPAEEKEYSHVALLGTGKNLKDVEWFGSGSLISNQFILGAASHKKEANWAALGLQSRLSITADKLNRNVFKITQIFIHNKYTNDSAYNDIALYKLENGLVFAPTIRPICLYTSLEIPSVLQHEATVAGWGQADTEGINILRKGRIDFIKSEECIKKYVNDSKLNRGFDNDTMICAGNLIEDDITCVAQNGGPLQFPIPFKPCMWSQAGITVYGSNVCGDDIPTLYTKVYYYLDWIQKIVWPR